MKRKRGGVSIWFPYSFLKGLWVHEGRESGLGGLTALTPDWKTDEIEEKAQIAEIATHVHDLRFQGLKRRSTHIHVKEMKSRERERDQSSIY